jgi:uncharacterized protein (UPF0210 family)
MEDFLPYDKETARAITRAGKRILRKIAKELNIKKYSYA